MKHLILAALACAACATTKATPSELEPQVTRFQTFDNTSPISDFDAASYYGIVVDGQRLGEVAVWSNGAFMIEDNGQRVPILEVTLLARNESQTAFELDLAGTSVDIVEPTTMLIPEEYAVAGTRRVQPGETRRLGIRYRLPNEAMVQTITNWNLTFAMRTVKSGFVQAVPFRLLPPGMFQLGAEWPQTKRISYTQDNRRPWSIRWSQVTPEDGDRQVFPGEQLPPAKWKTPSDSPNG